MKKIAIWVVINILWPILRELLVDILKQLVKLTSESFQALLTKWFNQDVDAASSESEKENLRRRHEERMKDINEVTIRMTEKVEHIVKDALLNAEANRDNLLDSKASGEEQPKKLAS